MSGRWENAQEREQTREVTRRAIRRLRVFGWVVLAAAAVAAAIGGFLSALVLNDLFGIPFQPAWYGSAVAFFVIPGALALWKAREG